MHLWRLRNRFQDMNQKYGHMLIFGHLSVVNGICCVAYMKGTYVRGLADRFIYLRACCDEQKKELDALVHAQEARKAQEFGLRIEEEQWGKQREYGAKIDRYKARRDGEFVLLHHQHARYCARNQLHKTLVKRVGREYVVHADLLSFAYRYGLEASDLTVFDNTVKGVGALANKYINIDGEHIFGIVFELKKEAIVGISGFHDDFMQSIEKSGVIEFANKVMYKEGFYVTDLMVDGETISKSFFPADWPREKVIKKYMKRMKIV